MRWAFVLLLGTGTAVSYQLLSTKSQDVDKIDGKYRLERDSVGSQHAPELLKAASMHSGQFLKTKGLQSSIDNEQTNRMEIDHIVSSARLRSRQKQVTRDCQAFLSPSSAPYSAVTPQAMLAMRRAIYHSDILDFEDLLAEYGPAVINANTVLLAAMVPFSRAFFEPAYDALPAVRMSLCKAMSIEISKNAYGHNNTFALGSFAEVLDAILMAPQLWHTAVILEGECSQAAEELHLRVLELVSNRSNLDLSQSVIISHRRMLPRIVGTIAARLHDGLDHIGAAFILASPLFPLESLVSFLENYTVQQVYLSSAFCNVIAMPPTIERLRLLLFLRFSGRIALDSRDGSMYPKNAVHALSEKSLRMLLLTARPVAGDIEALRRVNLIFPLQPLF